jgi:hypothetical protein
MNNNVVRGHHVANSGVSIPGVLKNKACNIHVTIFDSLLKDKGLSFNSNSNGKHVRGILNNILWCGSVTLKSSDKISFTRPSILINMWHHI